MDKIIYSGPFGVGAREQEQRYVAHCQILIESAPLQVKVKLITGHGDVTAEISPGDALTVARELKIAAELALDSADYEPEISRKRPGWRVLTLSMNDGHHRRRCSASWGVGTSAHRQNRMRRCGRWSSASGGAGSAGRWMPRYLRGICQVDQFSVTKRVLASGWMCSGQRLYLLLFAQFSAFCGRLSVAVRGMGRLNARGHGHMADSVGAVNADRRCLCMSAVIWRG